MNPLKTDDSSDSMSLRGIYLRAAERKTPVERSAFLDGACGDNLALRSKVEALLKENAEDSFLEAPAVEGMTNLEETPLSEGSGTVIGRYKLLQKLGEGGMGVVYMAEQTEPVTRKVALKIIKLGMDTRQVVARFEAERQALAMMDHPNIAKVLDAGATDSGRPYFVMELVRGVPITEYCDKSRLSTQQRLGLFIPVCQAIQHAHQKGVIHRDIKPSNVMVTLNDGIPHPMVIDFGIAKATNQKLTEKTLFTNYAQMIGTPAYMSPEQAEMSKLDVDTRTDVYSLGVLLYELLTGTTPFPTKDLLSLGYGEMQKIIAEKEPPKPSTRLSTMQNEERTAVAKNRNIEAGALGRVFQGDLDWIVMKALEKDRTQRYETVNGLVADVKRHLNNEPVSVAAPTFRYQLSKFVRRNRKYARMAGAVAVLLMLATAFAAIQAVRATTARQRAEAAGRAELAQRVLAQEKQKEAEAAQAAEGRQRVRAEGLLDSMQLQRAGELLDREQTQSGAGHLIKMLRANPSNEVAAARLASAMMLITGHPESAPLRHDEYLTSAQFSPDGLRVLTACRDGTARVWDARTGESVTELLRHEDWVNFAQFSPDGLRAITASSDKTARVWDARTGQPVTEPLRHEGEVHFAEFSPDGLWVVTASADKTARVWDAGTGQPITEPLRHEGEVRSAQFSPDGLRVVTASWDKTAQVWDARTGQPVTEPLRHEHHLASAEFSPDGLRVVTASWDKTARVWDARTGQPVTAPLQHGARVRSARFSPDGLRVVTASEDRTARVWDVRTGQPLTDFPHDGEVSFAQFSSDGLRVLTASLITARVWDAGTGEPVTEPLRHNAFVFARFSPDGLRVVTASLDKTARVWDVRPGRPIAEFARHRGSLSWAQFSPDGLRVVTASTVDKTARVWDLRTGLPVTPPLQHEEGVYSAVFSPDGLRVVTGSSDKSARVWDARTGEPVTEPLRHEEEVRSAQFSPDGLRVVTASWDKTARVWDARTGQPVTGPLRHEGRVRSARFSPDGLRVVTASYDKTARVWDSRTGEPVTEPLRHEHDVSSAQFSPDGLQVVTASGDNTARVWDARTGQPVTEPLRHDDIVHSAEFSPDGLRVVTASLDRTARLWDAQTGQPVTESLRHDQYVSYAQFSPDGLRVVTASKGTVQVWDARTGQPVTNPLWHNPLRWDSPVYFPQFSPDGLRVVTASAYGAALVWEIPPTATPVPNWFLDWAETRLGLPFSAGSPVAAVGPSERLRLQQVLAARTDTNYYTRLAQWVEADPTTRTLSPFAVLTLPEYVQRRITENSLRSLNEALRLNPTNSLAWARLALLQATQGTNQASGNQVEAEFSARLALRLDPSNGEAWLALGRVQFQAGRWNEASRCAEMARQFLGDDWITWELLGDVLARQERGQDAFDAYRRASSAVIDSKVEGLHARATLLRKTLEVLPPADSVTADPAREASFQEDLQRFLTLGNGLSDEASQGLQPVLKELAAACAKAGRTEEMDQVIAASRKGSVENP